VTKSDFQLFVTLCSYSFGGEIVLSVAPAAAMTMTSWTSP
jgi:hypothetical protein